MNVLVCLIVIATVVLLVVLFVRLIAARNKKIVLETSTMLKKLSAINTTYDFKPIDSKLYVSTKCLPTKAKYDKCTPLNVLDGVLWFDRNLENVMGDAAYNSSLYDKYQTEIQSISSEANKEQCKKLHVPLSHYVKTERELFSSQQLTPITNVDLKCIATYTSPGGRNTYSRAETYNTVQCLNRAAAIRRQWERQNTEEMRRLRERALMTDKLRYKILKRDGFRCQICGRSAEDGVKLHIDHIIPVSKGGKTVESNLRVLCEDCNLGKGDTIE